jgi:hypothetical protein
VAQLAHQRKIRPPQCIIDRPIGIAPDYKISFWLRSRPIQRRLQFQLEYLAAGTGVRKFDVLAKVGALFFVFGVFALLFQVKFIHNRGIAAGILFLTGLFFIGVSVSTDGNKETVAYVPAPASIRAGGDEETKASLEKAPVASTASSDKVATAKPAPAPSPAMEMPWGQKAFIAAVEAGRTAYQSGSNDMQKGAARPARAKALCSVLGSKVVYGWVGQVEKLSSNGDGKGVLVIRIAKEVYIKTWNNAVSDIGDKTLIEPASSLFSKASALSTGQWVKFSGSFRPSDTDCVRESSMTLSGSLTEPEFIFKFSEIAAR